MSTKDKKVKKDKEKEILKMFLEDVRDNKIILKDGTILTSLDEYKFKNKSGRRCYARPIIIQGSNKIYLMLDHDNKYIADEVSSGENKFIRNNYGEYFLEFKDDDSLTIVDRDKLNKINVEHIPELGEVKQITLFKDHDTLDISSKNIVINSSRYIIEDGLIIRDDYCPFTKEDVTINVEFKSHADCCGASIINFKIPSTRYLKIEKTKKFLLGCTISTIINYVSRGSSMARVVIIPMYLDTCIKKSIKIKKSGYTVSTIHENNTYIINKYIPFKKEDC